MSDVEVRPSASRIVSGPSHRFGPLGNGVIVTRPALAVVVAAFVGSRAGSEKPVFTCVPSQNGLSED